MKLGRARGRDALQSETQPGGSRGPELADYDDAKVSVVARALAGGNGERDSVGDHHSPPTQAQWAPAEGGRTGRTDRRTGSEGRGWRWRAGQSTDLLKKLFQSTDLLKKLFLDLFVFEDLFFFCRKMSEKMRR